MYALSYMIRLIAKFETKSVVELVLITAPILVKASYETIFKMLAHYDIQITSFL
jgi:hypothetical protein